MRKVSWFMILGLMFAVLLTGCGEKSQDEVVTDLEKRLADMSGYKTHATMTLQTGKDPQTYDVEVWHQEKSYYRVALENENKDQSQIILRNDDGVFVLTPSLNKSFRFQSDWPTNSSQVYLYESLIQDILIDGERTFTSTEDHYVFETKTNYQNKNLHAQEITLNKRDLTPVQVKIMNADLELLVQVDFRDFELEASFNEGDFEMERNMTGAQIDEPTMAEPSEPFVVHYPMYEPQGSEYIGSKEIETEDGKRVVLQYGGEQSYTIIQEQSRIVPASTPMHADGEPVDLGFTVGVMSEDSIMWSYNGVDFFLAAPDMDQEEMMAIARSVYGTQEK
ncbi:outer membrane lipoprotein carrier protein LolA [Halalkalibacterium halodurans]|uniref:Sporulation protein n=1 Tax=Halalkalibacterium halodurans TaxID=86665 RepID=A0A0M0KDV0_ALKHA|nr:outer membrane lipoprotein carrier protein LolA [Halalkalibacterium halodurans]MED3645882.1 outer membrane lipoprotein carrier protein LolA [Halalkalibacterium halodurans]MED4161599.1 outer membrane lipoprotein carrier protein LolA [Halalkalibacterium halodurans]TPE69826.1 outer membrane lipoprotein carrier protein LolA [Halalkalibacterium halodurans]